MDLSGKEDFGTASGLFSTHNSTYNHLNIAHGETAYTWGNHAGLYTPIAHKTTEDAINGIVKINGAGTYSAVTDNSSNWNTAYGWGNHASAGYSTTTQLGAKLDTTNATYLNRYHWNLAYGWGNHAAAGYIGSPVNNAWYLTKDAAGNSANVHGLPAREIAELVARIG